MKKKILIIGYGSMGKKYEKILSKKFEIKFFDKKKIKKKKINLKNLKKENFFFAIISSPANTHKYYCELLIKNNINFLVEKPLFINTLGWDKIIRKANKKKIICSVAYPRREGKAYHYIKKLIFKKKIIGKLKIIKSNYSQDFRKYRKDYKKIYYSSKRTGGGIALDALTHHINLMSFYLGKIKKIDVFEKNIELKEVNVNDTALLNLYFKNNSFGFIFGNQFQKPNVDEFEFIGTRGNLSFNRIQNKLLLHKEKKIFLLRKFNQSYEEMFETQIYNFIRALNNKAMVSTTLIEDYNNLKKLIK